MKSYQVALRGLTPDYVYLFFFAACLFMGLLFITAPAYSSIQYEGGGILYSKNAAFNLDAPKGWVFDTESGNSIGLYCVMYPKGGSWDKSPAVIYANIGDMGNRTLEQYIADDMKEMQKNASNKIVYKMSKKYDVGKDYLYIVVDSFGINNGYERTLYICSEKSVCIVVLSTQDKTLLLKYKNTIFEVIKNLFSMHLNKPSDSARK